MNEQRIEANHKVNIDGGTTAGRLDRTLSAVLREQRGLEVSTKRVRALCDAGKVRLNGRIARSGDRVVIGDLLEVFDEIESVVVRPDLAAASGIELAVAHEDKDFIVVVKPRGVHTVRLRPDDPVTLADLIAARFPEAAASSPDPRESGAVQRLDYFTSGLVLVARKAKIWQHLHQMIIQGQMQKRYRALVEGGIPRNERVEIAMQPSKDRSRTITAEEGTGEIGDSHVQPGRQFQFPSGNVSIAVVESSITKRHQVRFHLSEIGHALVGDEQYGSRRKLIDIPGLSSDPECKKGGFLLHAESMEFRHPLTNGRVSLTVESPLFEKIGR